MAIKDLLNEGKEKAVEVAKKAYEDAKPKVKEYAKEAASKLADEASKHAEKAAKDLVDKVIPKAKELANEAYDYTKEKAIPKAKEIASDAKTFVKETAAPEIKKAAVAAKEKGAEVVTIAGNKALKQFDKNGDGTFDFKDILCMALEIPGVKIDRADFLQKSFAKVCKQETIDDAITNTPAIAGIKLDTVNKIADEVIEYERNRVTATSTGLGVIPGGVGVAISTSVADIVQYYGFMIRVAQKLMYLYGFPQADFQKDNQPVDDGTMNVLMLCLGAMNGIKEAVSAIKGLANGLAKGVSKTLLKKALTKGTIYPIIKKVWNFMGGHMTKDLLASGVSKSILIVGGVLSGGITYLSFQKCCNNFKVAVNDTMLSNPNGHIDDADVIDIEINEAE